MPRVEREGYEQVNISLPKWMVDRLDAWKDGVRRTRSAVIADMIERRAITDDGVAVGGRAALR